MMHEDAKFSMAQMLIRKPAATVFEAFIDPSLTRNFWFTGSSGRLEEGREVIWEWEMYGVSTTVTAREIVPDEKIVFEWGNPATTVVFVFKRLHDGATYVTAKEYGYRAEGDALLAVIRDSTGGFTTVLDGLKAFLEHGIRLNLIGDKFPRELKDAK